MKALAGYNEAKASGDFERLPAGGYVIRITGVKDDTEKEYLQVVYDIAEGPEAGRYERKIRKTITDMPLYEATNRRRSAC